MIYRLPHARCARRPESAYTGCPPRIKIVPDSIFFPSEITVWSASDFYRQRLKLEIRESNLGARPRCSESDSRVPRENMFASHSWSRCITDSDTFSCTSRLRVVDARSLACSRRRPRGFVNAYQLVFRRSLVSLHFKFGIRISLSERKG